MGDGVLVFLDGECHRGLLIPVLPISHYVDSRVCLRGFRDGPAAETDLARVADPEPFDVRRSF